MSAPNEGGRQSPSLENQSPEQGRQPPSDAKGLNDGSDNQKESKSTLEGLSSNPKGPLDDHAEGVGKKTVENIAGDVKH